MGSLCTRRLRFRLLVAAFGSGLLMPYGFVGYMGCFGEPLRKVLKWWPPIGDSRYGDSRFGIKCTLLSSEVGMMCDLSVMENRWSRIPSRDDDWSDEDAPESLDDFLRFRSHFTFVRRLAIASNCIHDALNCLFMLSDDFPLLNDAIFSLVRLCSARD